MTDPDPDPGPALVDLLGRRSPTLGGGRLLVLDGPAGSGKTTAAAAVAAVTGAPVVHMDDLYDGWSGLARVDVPLATLLEPLARGEEGSYRRYDWHAGAYAETVRVAPTPLLVLEGVGSGAAAYRALVTLLVWVEAPSDLRFARGLARDGEPLRERWEQWRRDEDVHLAADRTRLRADVVLDGTGGSPLRVRPASGWGPGRVLP